jgi:hypothetical protein
MEKFVNLKLEEKILEFKIIQDLILLVRKSII